MSVLTKMALQEENEKLQQQIKGLEEKNAQLEMYIRGLENGIENLRKELEMYHDPWATVDKP